MNREEFFEVVRSIIPMDSYSNFNVKGDYRTYRINPNDTYFKVESLNEDGSWKVIGKNKYIKYGEVSPKKVETMCNRIIQLSNTERTS